MSVKNLLKGAIVFSLLLTSSVVFAQQMQKKTPEERAQGQTQWMQKNLAINDDQSAKVYNIILKYAQQASTAEAGQRQQIMASRDAEIKGVLTGDQYQQYQAHEQQMRAQMQQRKSGGGGMQNGN